MPSKKPKPANRSIYPENGVIAQMCKPQSLKLTYDQLQEKIGKEIARVTEPLKSYKDFVEYKGHLSCCKTEINQTEDRLRNLRSQEAELERAVAQFAKTLKEEAEEALR